jgi:hypothetical protein
MFHHNAYVGKWIGHMSGIFHLVHMHIHEQNKWSFHRQSAIRKDVVLL